MVPVFMVIWKYDVPEAVALVEWAVIVYNTESIKGIIKTLSLLKG